MKDRFSVGRVVATLSLAFVALVSACGRQPLASNPPIVVRSELGALEQQLSVRLLTSNSGERVLAISSRVVNRGTSPTRVTLRTCLFRDGDVQSTAQLAYQEPLISCGAVEMIVTLGASQAGLIEGSFAVRSGPGTYQVSVRHALDPELRAAATFSVP
ncbi:MAG: hypothetical protein ACRD2A_18535 [Vicinamibacterales bacterium]